MRPVWLRALRGLRGTSFVLIASAATVVTRSPASITIVLTDHHCRLSAPVKDGQLAWHVKNDGSEPHQALVVKLPDGVSEDVERAWFEHGSKGPEPGESIGVLHNLGMIERFEIESGQGMNVNLTWPVTVLVSPSSEPPSGRVRVVTRT